MTFWNNISVIILITLLPLSAFPQKDKKITVKDTRKYVDLGLPSGTLWATCNIGASKPEEFGLYFAWGETKGHTSDTSDGHKFEIKNYKWYDFNSKYPKLLKYRINRNGIADKKVLDPEDDAATVNWGSKWQIPSLDQIKELCDSTYTTAEWTTLNGVNGRKITSKKNDNWIFLPAANIIITAGSSGIYWSRTLYMGMDDDAVTLEFYKDKWFFDSHTPRYYGLNIRPVRSQKNRKEAKPEITEGDVMIVPVEVPLPE